MIPAVKFVCRLKATHQEKPTEITLEQVIPGNVESGVFFNISVSKEDGEMFEVGKEYYMHFSPV